MGWNPSLHFLLHCPAPRKPPPPKQSSLFGTLVRELPKDVSQHYVYLWVKAEEIRGGQRGGCIDPLPAHH